MLGLLILGPSARAYDGDIHQALTFLAAKEANRCLQLTGHARLSALQVRYVAKANKRQAEGSVLRRMVRWNYYNRDGLAERRTLLGLVDTRFHEHFNQLLLRLERDATDNKRYANLGRLVSYMQDVTTPAHTVPVFTGRFWRLSMSDRFDHYDVDLQALERSIGDVCLDLADTRDFESVLRESAEDTLAAVQAPMQGMRATWQAFWRLAKDPSDFGDYGSAGNNFGRQTSFRCERGKPKCELLDDDPLYREFALERHRAAVIATMRAMYLMQVAVGQTDGNSADE